MPALVLARLRLRLPIAALLVALPVFLFYAILLRTAIDVPIDDDYEALLNFLNQIVERKGMSAKIAYFFASQFNEYKLFFGHAVAWLQLALFGHVDIRILCAFGNGFVLLLGMLLWKMFLPAQKDLGDRLVFFIPVSWMLFQLQYAETLNWAMPSLQNVPILLFALATIYLLVQADAWSFCGAMVCLLLAVATSGNGFLVVPIGLVILATGRYYARIVAWLLVFAGCIAAYAYHYNVMSSQSRLQGSVFATVIRPRPLYVFAFLGSSASFPYRGHFPGFDIGVSVFLGIVLCIFFVFLWRRGYFHRNSAAGYCILFLLLTAVGVAGLRSDFGVAQSLGSRYAIYSVLLLIFAWFAIVEEFLLTEQLPAGRKLVLPFVMTGVILFSLIMDQRGSRYLWTRDHKIISGMAAYEHPGSGPGPILPFKGQGPRFDEMDRRAPEILRQSTRLGIYEPPPY